MKIYSQIRFCRGDGKRLHLNQHILILVYNSAVNKQ